MDKAIYGLVGVALGVFLTVVKEWWFQHRKNVKDAEYLSIQMISLLDRYVAGCVEVVSDDGLYMGQPDEQGYSRIQVETPKFEPGVAKVEWKSLPTVLMYEVLTFPNNIEVANSRISAAFEHAASPPDYSEGFEERQLKYAELGLEADSIATKLRGHANLPPKPKRDWDPIEFMKDRRQQILRDRAEREKRHQELMEKLSEIESQRLDNS
ncbi:hypothetical protein MYE70_10255 [Marinobacter alexandrii]|uniref:hypothetical protein n=1 Tax=Marinobacter alexandrii TaxID=2570351 RepID=UPI001FFF652F|nr:hypothetical protein [Marinobacter alexandrii]MCK2149448.1 hypothetical protein [Marinobacter alexandrii]